MNGSILRVAGALALVGMAVAVDARWTEVPATQPVAVASSRLAVAPPARWNRWSSRPGKRAETWSFDGPLLNRVDFFAAIAPGEPLLREHDRRRNPLPRFATGMSATEVAELFERTSRIREQAADFTVDAVAPTPFAGTQGFRFTYHYTDQSSGLLRRGLATGAVLDGKLFLIAFTAPALHYYEARLVDAQAIMDGARLL